MDSDRQCYFWRILDCDLCWMMYVNRAVCHRKMCCCFLFSRSQIQAIVSAEEGPPPGVWQTLLPCFLFFNLNSPLFLQSLTDHTEKTATPVASICCSALLSLFPYFLLFLFDTEEFRMFFLCSNVWQLISFWNNFHQSTNWVLKLM